MNPSSELDPHEPPGTWIKSYLMNGLNIDSTQFEKVVQENAADFNYNPSLWTSNLKEKVNQDLTLALRNGIGTCYGWVRNQFNSLSTRKTFVRIANMVKRCRTRWANQTDGATNPDDTIHYRRAGIMSADRRNDLSPSDAMRRLDLSTTFQKTILNFKHESARLTESTLYQALETVTIHEKILLKLTSNLKAVATRRGQYSICQTGTLLL